MTLLVGAPYCMPPPQQVCLWIGIMVVDNVHSLSRDLARPRILRVIIFWVEAPQGNSPSSQVI